MQKRSRLRMLGAAVVIASATGVAAVAIQPATAAPVAETGAVAHFAVLGAKGPAFGQAEKAVTDAGGTVVKSWPEIGVVIATSSNPEFAKIVRGMPGVQGAGATQNLAELAAPPAATTMSTERSAARGAGAAQRALEDTEQVVDSAKGSLADPEPLAANQWDMKMIKADEAHAINAGSSDVVVGVLDSGIEASHPDLAANVDASRSVGCTNQGVPDSSPAAWNPTTSDHGTHVAGSIAAARNGVGIVGVAPGVKLASIKVVNDDGYIYPEYAICGFMMAAEKGVHVTNNSYFVDPWYLWCKGDADQKAVAEAVDRAIQYSHRKGVVNVAALGNSNWDLSRNIMDDGSPNNGTPIERDTDNTCTKIPAEIHGVVGVSSVGVKGLKSYFSNYGRTETEVAAPGGDRMQVPSTPDANGRILSTVVGGKWGYKQGTSMASPHAAGVVALIRSAHPGWSAQRVVASLMHDADRLACPTGTYDPDGTGTWTANCDGGKTGRGFYGAGLIDALDAVK
ncbi:S8 family peptidase [Actinokineospora alba]|nr:S8 family serine peptidase [Actinokineospora alba]TDP65366.1 subtilase family protein [Actinokineospora alba]